MKHIAVVAIFGLIALNAVFKPITGIKPAQQTHFADLEFEDKTALAAIKRIKREHTGNSQSFIDLILKIMNSLQLNKPNIAKAGQRNYINAFNQD